MSQKLDHQFSQLTNQQQQLYRIRHTAEHVLHTAMQELYPELKKAMGPATDDGFYFDFDLDHKITPEDFPAIEAKMQEIIDANLPMTQEFITEAEAKDIFQDNPYKLDWVARIGERGEKLSIFKMGDRDLDLCSGPHAESTGKVRAFKLLSIAGAYWHGDEKEKMLTRIYGTAYDNRKDLKKHLTRLEEAAKRDHKKLGPELDLFVFSETVGKGLPLWTPKGATVRRELERYIVDEELARGYLHVYTPDIANLKLYEKSGHYPYYKDSMYAPIVIDESEYMLRPMTCPHHFELYLSKPHSYKELPMRIAELAQLYRYEKSGELMGLLRVRTFCLADAHIVCRKDQAEAEIHAVLDLIESIAHTFGLKPEENYTYRLSLGDRTDPDKYYKDDASWEFAENVLRTALTDRNAPFVEAEAEAAFYGPKIDVQMRNVNGKEDTAFTVQYDFVMPGRFNLTYTNEQGQQEQAIVIHRSSIGAIERVMAFLIEHFAGNFPTWLAPTQVAILPISEEQFPMAQELDKQLKALKVRTSLNQNPEPLGAKIKAAQLEKTPYMIVIGAQESEKGTLTIRRRDGKQIKDISVDQFLKQIGAEITNRSLDFTLS